jgi:hypothetical protein
MSFADIGPLLLIVLFWLVLFGLTFWFSRVALNAPTEAELEAAHADAGHAH